MEAQAHGAGTRFAGRISRHAAAYGVGSFTTALAGLVSVAVFTRYLDPAEFGKMAVLTTVAMLATLVSSLTILPGTMRRVYGTTGDEDLGDVDAEDMAKVVSSDPRLALTTGLALTLVMGAAIFALAWALQGTLAAIFGSAGDVDLILLAVGAGVAATVMRFCLYILRMQLRSTAYVVVSLISAFASIALAIPLLVEGLGVEAVLLGLIVGNILAALIGLLLLAVDLGPAVSLHEAKAIMRGGIAYLPVILSFQTMMLADTLFVAAFANFSQTGLYRVAQRIAMPVGFGTSVFQQSWGPMRHDMTQVAVDRLDEERTYTSRLFTYYAVFVATLALFVAVFADQLVRLAAGSFSEAAALVPVTTVSIAGHGWFILSYRLTHLPGHMRWLIGLAIFAAVTFAGLSVVLIPVLDAAGAPVAAIIAWGLATAIMLGFNQLRGDPIPFEYRNLLLLTALTLSAGAFAHWVLPDTSAGVLAKLVVLLCWAWALVAAKVVPVDEVRALGRYARDASGVDSKRQLRARIAELDGLDAELVDQVVRRRQPPEEVAERAGMSSDEVMAHVVHALRCAGGGGEPTDADAELGHLILIRRPRAERDMGLMTMAHGGVDPLDADLIVRVTAAASSRQRLWRLYR
ncbi:MAG TPA: oligosaccharide flippase family protein [Solirubrobacterales bacterium]|nr:oligosaccharide flippase family protein [Solirubrobacterales bacterium]